MKTTLLFSACLFIAAASFAQTTVKNDQESKTATNVNAGKSGLQSGSSTNASSSASIYSDAVNKTETKVQSDAKKGKKAISAEKKTASEKVKATEKEVKNTASGDHFVSGEEKSDADVSAGNKGNKIDENSSLNGQALVSVSGAETTGKQLEKDGKTSVASTKSVAAQNSDAVKAKADKAVIKADKKVKTSGTAVKTKPANIKMNTQVKTNAAIRIK